MLFPLYDLNPHRRVPWLTVLIIVVNVAILASQGSWPGEDAVYNFGFIPKRITQVGSGKLVSVRVPALDDRGNPIPGRRPNVKELSTRPLDVYPTLVTAMFLHGGWLHLLSNMWMLWIFGNNIEDRLGHFMFVCYYLIGGMAGNLCQWAVDPQLDMPVIGASGAVATVLGGYAITFPKAAVKTLVFIGIPLLLNLPALIVLGAWFLFQLVFGLGIVSGIDEQAVAYWAHIGGFVAGIVLLPFLALGAPPADADWKREVRDMFQFDDPRSPSS